jgi:hypothetical protein
LVEQRIRNAKVTSSIPVSGTKSGKKGSQKLPLFTSGSSFFVAAASRPCLQKPKSGGNPAISTDP